MKIQTVFRMSSPYRDDFRVKAYTFGQGVRSLCIVGSMRGDEMQQQYVASMLVRRLREAEQRGMIARDVCISVVPCANPSSINIEKRFWALDGTDINRMFPGYDRGETTQRIAAGIFEFIKDFRFGVQLASYYLPGNFVPHVRMIHTRFECVEGARLFGLPYVVVSEPKPFDTVLLNYNWQIWDTEAFSLYAGTTDVIDYGAAEVSVAAVSRFLEARGLAHLPLGDDAAEPVVVSESVMIDVKAPRAGLLLMHCSAGQMVGRGEVLTTILHPYEGYEVCSIVSPADATVFFMRNRSICFENTLLFRLIAR